MLFVMSTPLRASLTRPRGVEGDSSAVSSFRGLAVSYRLTARPRHSPSYGLCNVATSSFTICIIASCAVSMPADIISQVKVYISTMPPHHRRVS
jgi:hypothetical protein